MKQTAQVHKAKIMVLIVIGIFLISFVSANIFTDILDFIIGNEKEGVKTPSYVKLGLNETTFNTFNTKVNEIKTIPIYLKTLDVKYQEKTLNYDPLDVSNTNYFYTNNQGVIRVKNE